MTSSRRGFFKMLAGAAAVAPVVAKAVTAPTETEAPARLTTINTWGTVNTFIVTTYSVGSMGSFTPGSFVVPQRLGSRPYPPIGFSPNY